MLDLNKEPSENKMVSPKSPSSSDYFLAEEGGKDVDSSLNMDVIGNAAAVNMDGKGGEGDKEAGKKIPSSVGGENFEGFAGEAEFSLPSVISGLIREEMREAETLECAKNAATGGVVATGLRGGDPISSEAVGRKRRGRKRKVVESGMLIDGSLESDPVKCESAKFAKIEEGGSKLESSEDGGKDTDTGGHVAPDGVGITIAGRQETSKGRRGRKRKVLESGHIDKQAEKLTTDGSSQTVGRVLRSRRTIMATVCEKLASSEENADVGDREIDMGLDQSDWRSTNREIDESAHPTRTRIKKLKGRRGRPRKLHGNMGIPELTVNKKINVGSKKNLSLHREKVLKDSNLLKLQKENGKYASQKAPKEKFEHKKEGEMGRLEEKQLLKNQIISILKEAGWTIEYRPRMSKDYLDAVYVDHQGRTYWSVTKAYKKLKQMVEDGTADAKAISAFTPIPEDKFCLLFRITKEKGKKRKKLPKVGGSKNEKGDTKQNLISRPNHGDKSSRKEIRGDSCGQEDSMVFSGRRKPKPKKAGGRKPCALLARCAENGLDHENDGFKVYSGKRTLLAWMIDMGTVSPGGKVQYMNHKRTSVLLKGKITGEGIYCDCCDKVVSYFDFEAHAGSTLGQPYENIYFESGHSLLQCMIESWTKQELIHDIGFRLVNVHDDDPNDDICNICANGGDLICCDGCPSTFHQSCLQIQNCPSGYWRCAYCSCKFCGLVCGRASLSDDILDIDDSESFTCHFCEEKFHVHCRQRKDSKDVNSEDLSFCGKGCQKLFEHLMKLLGVRHELEEGYSWSVLCRQYVNRDASYADSSKIECNSKLAIALSIMDECFLPIIDERSNINMIHSVLYSCGSNFRRLNCSGFFTFILERGNELLSAATIRVHGNQLAEMPFIGTRSMYRRQGMCRRLLTAIEMALSSLGVEKLVIPAVSELNETWTQIFGFVPLEESKRQEMKYMSMISFPGTDMLQKPLFKDQLTKEKITSVTGLEISQPINKDVKGDTTPMPASCVVKHKQNIESPGALETSNVLNDESIPKSLSGNHQSNDPQPCMISSKLSRNNLCSNGSFYHSCLHPEVA
ncbi:hypothetical protein ACH5RR_009079 [Cinchona calisaya]|uniref:Acyl-CoA N-acyltransferase n=1 Tax=Cinchona calisaya TaxID=153742 RepID=A0ABD3AGX8_9GENT